jgi:hypothetical protein
MAQRNQHRIQNCKLVTRPILIGAIALTAALSGQRVFSQAITISSKSSGPVDRRFAQIEPTKVDLPQAPIDAKGHQDILRVLTAEQGFAMRPLPRGKKGLTLAANGKLSPAGEGYVNEVSEKGLSAKPGDRVVLSNIKIEKERIVFELNDGPSKKHEFLRHIEIGAGGPDMTQPIVHDNGQEPTGSRIILTFQKYVPDVTPAQLKALLAPLISFDVKTPVQAFTDTLPPRLKEAILGHNVLVGMSTDMVLFAMGQPDAKSRELEGQMPFEEWIYGRPPEDVKFVRVNGNRVIRVEVAKLGQPLEIFTKDEVEGQMMTNGQTVRQAEAQREIHPVQMGDVHRDPNTQSADAPPTLRAPGEKLPDDKASPGDPNGGNRVGPDKPVLFPKDTTKDPANTVNAHPEKAKPTAKADPDTTNEAPAKPAGNDKPAQPATPPPPSSNFYSEAPRPASR